MCSPDDAVCIRCGHPLSQHHDEPGQPGYCQEMVPPSEDDDTECYSFCGCDLLMPLAEDDDGDAHRGFQ
jgi:hypothetical protein